MSLDLSDKKNSPPMLIDENCNIRGVRVDVADYLKERAEELDVSFEDSITIVLALGLHSIGADPKPCLGELCKNPEVMALFK